jgi:hypothetical protein
MIKSIPQSKPSTPVVKLGNTNLDETLLFGKTKSQHNNKKVIDLTCVLGLVQRTENKSKNLNSNRKKVAPNATSK